MWAAPDERWQLCARDLRAVLQGLRAGPADRRDRVVAQHAGRITGVHRLARGQGGLVDFWAYSCINCQRAVPHLNAWYSADRGDGFEVIGVHTPEYAFEQVANNVAAGVQRLGIRDPVALDNDDDTTFQN